LQQQAKIRASREFFPNEVRSPKIAERIKGIVIANGVEGRIRGCTCHHDAVAMSVVVKEMVAARL